MPRPAVPGSDVVMMEEMRIEARRENGQTVFDSYDASQLFERGTTALNEGRCHEAVEQYYERLVRQFPSSRFVVPALYNSGICLHEGGELEGPPPRTTGGVVERAFSSRDGRHAALQLAQVLVNLERWDEAAPLTERILLREDLEVGERLEGLARRAQVLLGLGEIERAQRQARDALSFYRMRERQGEAMEPYFAAAANFVLAETIRQRSEAIELPDATAEEQHQSLDARARLVLDAQREYFNTIRHTDATWAAAAGYRIGAMYDSFWHSLMRAPVPPPSEEMNEATLALYREEYRQELSAHIRPLIRHAIRYWEMTLMMVERTGVRTEWTERTRTDLERMRALMLEQNEVEEPEASSETEPAPEDSES